MVGKLQWCREGRKSIHAERPTYFNMTLQVIDWKEALQQCGEDEDFLKELMLDLKSESGKQIAAMEEIIRVRDVVGTSRFRLHQYNY